MGVVNMAWEPYKDGFRARVFKPRIGLYKHGLTYDKQGAIYFACKHYFTLLSAEEQERFMMLLWECGKYNEDHYTALFLYLTSELSVQEICKKFEIGRSNFYRYVDEFYLNFNYVKRVY